MRAQYSSKSEGHYGLSMSHYTHFTSPIRRYADLIVHRSLFEAEYTVDLEKVSQHITGKERESSDAERDSKNVKLFSYLESQFNRKEGVRYKAVVSGIKPFGIFIELPELGMKGAIPLSLLKDDYYQVNDNNTAVRGRRRGKLFKLADEIHVKVEISRQV